MLKTALKVFICVLTFSHALHSLTPENREEVREFCNETIQKIGLSKVNFILNDDDLKNCDGRYYDFHRNKNLQPSIQLSSEVQKDIFNDLQSSNRGKLYSWFFADKLNMYGTFVLLHEAGLTTLCVEPDTQVRCLLDGIS